MARIARLWWRTVARSLGVLYLFGAAVSCREVNIAQLVYGPHYVELPVGAVGYQPPSPVHAGTVLTFTAELPAGNIDETAVNVGTEVLGWQVVQLHDDGAAPDIAANDRTFTGRLEWRPEFGVGDMSAAVSAHGEIDGSEATGQKQLPPLTVLP